MSDFDLLTIGDVTMDAFIHPKEGDAYCSVDDKESVVCFDLGDKIPVDTFSLFPGGNAANNAVGATRFGIKTSLVTTLGNESIGNVLLQRLQDEGVDLTYAIQQMHARTNYSTILSFGGERTIFSYHAPRSYEFPLGLPETPWVYLTSMGESFRPFYNHFLEWVEKYPNTKIAFNPGSRQLRALDSIETLWDKLYMLYVNREEACRVTGCKTDDIKELLKKLHEKGPNVCIVTDGSRGSFVYDGERFLKAGVIPVNAFERTGAGDAFGSACLSAFIKGKSLEEAMLWGTLNAASVIGFIGAHEGLLTEGDLAVWMERAKSSEVKVEEF